MKDKNLFSYFVQDYFSVYLPNIKNNSTNTIKTYKYVFIDLLNFFDSKNIEYKNIIMNDFKVEYIEKYIEELKIKKNSNSTINLKIVAIKNFFNYLNFKSIEYIDIANKINKINLIRKDVNIPKYLTKEEINIMLNCKNRKISLKEYVIFIILYYGGLRVNELCNLKKEDISIIDGSTFRIKIYNSKNNKSRVINFECNFGKSIKEYLKNYDYEEETYLFISKYKKQYTKKGINYIINKIYNLAKIDNKDKLLFNEKNIHPHMIRHSRAMIMLGNGISLSEIKEFLGHSYISTTEIYARLDNNLIKESIENHAKSINFKNKYKNKDKENLQNWLKTQ